MNFDCCGEETDGLFPIVDYKLDGDEIEQDITTLAWIVGDKVPAWCGVCWERPDCQGPQGGICYKGEGEEGWLEEW